MKKQKKKNRRKTSRVKARDNIVTLTASDISSIAKRPAISHTMIWFGAILTSFTFLGGLQTVIDFSPWASWFLKNWMGILEAVWSRIFALFRMRAEKDAIIPGTFIFAMFFMAIGAMILDDSRPTSPEQKSKKFFDALFDDEINARRSEGLAVGATIALASITVINWHLFDSQFQESDLNFWWMKWVLWVLTPTLFIALAFIRPFSDYCHLVLLTISMVSLYTLMLIPAANAARLRGGDELWRLAFMVVNLSVFLFPSQMMTMLTVAKPRFWNYRMIYVWCTIALLLVLDWIARNSISLKPPG